MSLDNLDDHKIVQLAADTAEVNDRYVGKLYEVTVDYSNWCLRLHDAVTPGGHKLLAIDQLVELFQARSVELDGLLGFKDQDRGLLARLGPATYRLRSLTVNGATLQVTRGDGYGGNPLIDLADDITDSQMVSGQWTFSSQILGTGGFKGNVEGNVVGNLTGDVLGDVTGDLTGNSTGSHTGSQTGNVDVRGHSLLLDDGQIHLAALNADVLAAIAKAGAPVGGIMMWSGTIDTIPEFWALCNGANGTPDLRDSFVMGAGLNHAPLATGGSATSLPGVIITNAGSAHTHTFTSDDHILTVAELPSHNHKNGMVDDNTDNLFAYGMVPTDDGFVGGNIQSQNKHNSTTGLTSTVGGNTGHHHGGTTDSGGAHTHGVTVSAGASIPPFYALAYIQKVS